MESKAPTSSNLPRPQATIHLPATGTSPTGSPSRVRGQRPVSPAGRLPAVALEQRSSISEPLGPRLGGMDALEEDERVAPAHVVIDLVALGMALNYYALGCAYEEPVLAHDLAGRLDRAAAAVDAFDHAGDEHGIENCVAALPGLIRQCLMNFSGVMPDFVARTGGNTAANMRRQAALADIMEAVMLCRSEEVPPPLEALADPQREAIYTRVCLLVRQLAVTLQQFPVGPLALAAILDQITGCLAGVGDPDDEELMLIDASQDCISELSGGHVALLEGCQRWAVDPDVDASDTQNILFIIGINTAAMVHMADALTASLGCVLEELGGGVGDPSRLLQRTHALMLRLDLVPEVMAAECLARPMVAQAETLRNVRTGIERFRAAWPCRLRDRHALLLDTLASVLNARIPLASDGTCLR